MAGKSTKPYTRDTSARTSIPKATKPGAGTGGSVGANEEGTDPCDILIEADLEGVRIDTLASLRVGETLRVEVFEQDGIPSAVCITANGSRIGSLSALEGLTKLIRCLRNGVSYEVTITELQAGRCHVRGTRIP